MPLTAQHLAPIDLALVALYLVGITLFGLRFSARNKGAGKTLKSYFLADNTIPWWAIALSIVSAETSTLTIVSIPGVAFAGDMGFLQVVLGYMLGRGGCFRTLSAPATSAEKWSPPTSSSTSALAPHCTNSPPASFY